MGVKVGYSKASLQMICGNKLLIPVVDNIVRRHVSVLLARPQG